MTRSGLISAFVLALACLPALAQDETMIATTLVSPSTVRTGYMPSPIPVAPAPGYTAPGLPALANPLTGSFTLAGVPGASWGIVLDEPATGDKRIFVDANSNGDYGDDPAISFTEGRGTLAATFQVRIPDGATLSFNTYRFLDNPQVSAEVRARRAGNLFYYRNYHHEGVLRLDGKEHRLVLIDMDNDARIGTGENERTLMFVDRNADGKIATGSGSAEEFGLEEAFEIGGKSFVVKAMDASGHLTIAPSATPAAPKPYLDEGYPSLPIAFTDALSGNKVDLAAYRGRIVLIDFWATWCGPCIAELPNVLDVYNSTPREKFDIIGISLDGEDISRLRGDRLEEMKKQYGTDDPAALQKAVYAEHLKKMKDFCVEKNMPWPQYYDGKGWSTELAAQWRVSGIPATFLIGPDGTIIARNLRGEALKAKVKELVGN